VNCLLRLYLNNFVLLWRFCIFLFFFLCWIVCQYQSFLWHHDFVAFFYFSVCQAWIDFINFGYSHFVSDSNTINRIAFLYLIFSNFIGIVRFGGYHIGW